MYQSEPLRAPISKPVRKNRSISSKSDLTNENRESIERESTTIEKFSPSNSRYTINIKETNGYVGFLKAIHYLSSFNLQLNDTLRHFFSVLTKAMQR